MRRQCSWYETHISRSEEHLKMQGSVLLCTLEQDDWSLDSFQVVLRAIVPAHELGSGLVVVLHEAWVQGLIHLGS